MTAILWRIVWKWWKCHLVHFLFTNNCCRYLSKGSSSIDQKWNQVVNQAEKEFSFICQLKHVTTRTIVARPTIDLLICGTIRDNRKKRAKWREVKEANQFVIKDDETQLTLRWISEMAVVCNVQLVLIQISIEIVRLFSNHIFKSVIDCHLLHQYIGNVSKTTILQNNTKVHKPNLNIFIFTK